MRFGLVAGATALLAVALVLWVLAGGREGRDGPNLPPKRVEASFPTPQAELVPPALAAPVDPAGPKAEPGAETSAVAPGGRDPARPPAMVLLFQHALHSTELERGTTWSLVLGANEAGRAFEDDQASAIEIPDDLQATLFEDAGKNGHRLSLGPGRHNLASYGFNDRVSSVWVARAGQDPSADGPADAVELFEHRAADRAGRGKVWRLSLPERKDERLFSASMQDFEARAVSTVWVPARHELTLFAEPDGRGPAVVLGPGLHELDYLNFNDRATSARVRRVR